MLSLRDRALLFLWLPVFVGFQAIPHTGALRTLAGLVGVVQAITWVGRYPVTRLGQTFPEVLVFVALTAWLAIPAFLQGWGQSAAHYLGEWGRLLLFAAFAAWFGRMAPRPALPLTMAALFAGCYLHVLGTLAVQATSFVRTGQLAWGMGLFGNYGYTSPYATTALVFLLADFVARSSSRQPLFSWSRGVSGSLLLSTLAAEFLLRSKAGQAMAGFLIVAALFLGNGHTRGLARWRSLGAGLGLLALLLAIAFASGRWQALPDEIALALRHPPAKEALAAIPPEVFATQGDGSFYLRMLWLRTAIAGIVAHPWGLGYGGDAFGRYLAERFGLAGAVSSHSGWADFALANGMPGLILLLLLAALLIHRGLLSWRKGHAVGLALALFTLHWVVRSAMDGLLYGSRILGFAFVTALLWVFAVRVGHGSRSD